MHKSNAKVQVVSMHNVQANLNTVLVLYWLKQTSLANLNTCSNLCLTPPVQQNGSSKQESKARRTACCKGTRPSSFNKAD